LGACAAALALWLAPLARADDVGPAASASALLRSTSGYLENPMGGSPSAIRAPRRGLRDSSSLDPASWKLDLDASRLALLSKMVDVGGRDFSAFLGSSSLLSTPANDATARLGPDGTFDLGNGFGLDVDDDEWESVPHMPQRESLTGRLAYDLFPPGPARPTLFLGCGARWIDLEDSRTMPSRDQQRAGALLIGGFSVSF
jgi:hypothetical protein